MIDSKTGDKQKFVYSQDTYPVQKKLVFENNIVI